MLRIWTDGACFPNPGRGGWAWVDASGQRGSGAENPTTNNRMEIMAAIKAIEPYRGRQIEIITDSMLVINAATVWRDNWIKRGWTTKGRQAIKNRELWEELFSLVDLNHIRFTWVKGHSGDEMNELADQLATAASRADRNTIDRCVRQWHGAKVLDGQV